MMLTGGAVMTEAAETQMVTKAGSNSAVQANPKNFTGTAWATSLFGAHPPAKTYAAIVNFTPGARTNWHIHAAGQSLIVTESFGYTQEWGKEIVALYPGNVNAQLASHMRVSMNTGITEKQLQEVVEVLSEKVGAATGKNARQVLEAVLTKNN